MLNRLWKTRSYRYKTLALLIAALIPLWAIVLFYVLPLVRESMYEDRRVAIRSTVDIASKVLAHYHELSEQKVLSVEEAQKQALLAVSKLRYNGNEYFWINDLHPTMLMHPFKPELNGKDLSDFKDPNGFRLFVAFAEKAKAKEGEGFVPYLWPKPGSPNPEPKISFVRNFAPWQWVVGSGVYVDDVEAAISSFRNKVLIGFSAAFVLAFGLFFVFAGRLMNFLARTVNETHGASQQVLEASNMLSSAGQNVAQGAVESAARIEETLSSIKSLNDIVQANQGRAREAAELAKNSEQGASQGAQEVKRLIESINVMAKISEEITSAMNIIDDIAFQTNLLALNAAVEAARAGEQGKGFAVVAEAVRNLAQRSAESAKNIAALIDVSVERIGKSAEQANRSGAVLTDIVNSVKKVSDLNSEIATASEEQSNGIEQMSNAMNQLDGVTQQNAAASEEAAATAEELSAQSTVLLKNVNALDLLVLGEGRDSDPSSPSSNVLEFKPKSFENHGKSQRKVGSATGF